MIQIICLILGIVYALRRPKLTAFANPGISNEKFEEWKRLELKSIDTFLWTAWGLLIISILAGFVVGSVFLGGTTGIQIVFGILFFLLLVVAIAFAGKAGKLKKQLGIKWP